MYRDEFFRLYSWFNPPIHLDQKTQNHWNLFMFGNHNCWWCSPLGHIDIGWGLKSGEALCHLGAMYWWQLTGAAAESFHWNQSSWMFMDWYKGRSTASPQAPIYSPYFMGKWMFPCRFTQQPVHYVTMFPGSLETKAMHHLSETPLFEFKPSHEWMGNTPCGCWCFKNHCYKPWVTLGGWLNLYDLRVEIWGNPWGPMGSAPRMWSTNRRRICGQKCQQWNVSEPGRAA